MGGRFEDSESPQTTYRYPLIRQTYEALTDPSRLLGFLIDQDSIGVTEGRAVYLQGVASDQVQAWLRDLLAAGLYYGAQEGIGAVVSLQNLSLIHI